LKRTFHIALLITNVIISGCGQKKEPVSQPEAPVKKEIKSIPFIPPADSAITTQQINSWLSCNTLLDSLATMYADSFKTANPAQRMKYQQLFTTAQDKICVITGLNGGYKEYKWILSNIGNPINKTIVESAGARLY
jgi:hypothetical protein